MIQRRIIYLISTVLFSLYTASYAATLTQSGWVEKAVLFPSGINLHAKLDTGAKSSSIDARNPIFYTRDGTRRVKFDVVNKKGALATIDAKIVRDVTIRRHYGNKQIRPVIELDICVGNIRKREEVNLIDRSNLNYPLLIGRNFLKDAFMVDAGSTYRLSPDCSD